MVEFAAPPIVYALALTPAVLWGLGPILDKRGMAGGGTTLQATVVVLTVDVVLFGTVMVGLGLSTGEVPVVTLPAWVVGLFVLGGLLGTALGRLATFAGVDRLGASVNTAALSSRPLFATGFAIALLGEEPSIMTLAGVVVLTLGLVTLTLGKGGDLRGWQPRQLAYPLVGAASFGLGNVVRRFGLTETPVTLFEALFVNEFAALVALGGFALAARRDELTGAPRRTYALFAGSGVLTAVSLFAIFAALAHPAGRVVVVDPLSASVPLFTTVFSYFLLRDLERVTPTLIAGAVLVVAGAALVTVA